MIAFTIPGDAVPFARAGRNGRRSFTPKKQADWMSVAALYARRAMEGQKPFDGALRMQVCAIYEPPASWSQRKRAGVKWKTSAPDLSNIVKLLEDAMNKIAFADDAQICELIAQKVYGAAPGVTVAVERLETRS